MIKRESNRIVCFIGDKETGYIDIEVTDHIEAKYIFVDPEFRGSDAKDQLIDDLKKLSKEKNMLIEATCKYLHKFFSRRHPEYLIK